MPKKNYNNRAMGTEVAMPSAPLYGEVFFFPKSKPPVSVRAGSLKEAENIVKAFTKQRKITQ